SRCELQYPLRTATAWCRRASRPSTLATLPTPSRCRSISRSLRNAREVVMKEARPWTLALALCAAGCATAPPPQPAPQSRSPEVGELRSALESATLRTLVVAPPPTVDVDAAVSMSIPQHAAVRSAVAYFTTELKSDVQRSLTRSARYRAVIDRALE